MHRQVNISVVIPVYNVEKYLKKCVDSVLEDVKAYDVELLLVDDGSTDRSGQMCDAYSWEYPEKIKTIHKENGGLSDARNAGILAAQGKYVCFLDSDDYYYPGAIKQIIDKIKTAAQVYVGAPYIFRDGTDELIPHEDVGTLAREGNRYTGFEAMDRLLGAIPTYGWYAWKYVVERSFLLENQFFFKKGILFEDVEWSPRMLAAAERVEILEEPFYCYRLARKNSIMNSANTERKCRAQAQMLTDHLQWIKASGVPEDLRRKLYQNLSGVYTAALYGSVIIKDRELSKELKEKQFLFDYIIRKTEFTEKRLYSVFGYQAVLLFYRFKAGKTALKQRLQGKH